MQASRQRAVLARVEPLPSPRPPAPFASDFDPAKSGVPEAPGFSLRSCGECSPAIASGNRHRSGGRDGMNPQRDQPSARAARRPPPRSAEGPPAVRHRRQTSARRRAAERMLFRQRELRSRRHHFTRANVHEPDVSLGRWRQLRRRLHYHVRTAMRALMTSLRRRRNTSDARGHAVGANCTSGAGATPASARRSQRGSRRIQRNRRNDGSGGDDVGQGNVVVELEIGRHDDGLRPVVRFRRNRKDRLLRVDGVSLLRLRRLGCARVERWQIFFRRIGYQRRPVKRGAIQNVLLSNPRERNRP